MILISLYEQPAESAAALIKLPAHVSRQEKGWPDEFTKWKISTGWPVIVDIDQLPKVFGKFCVLWISEISCFLVTQEALLQQEVCTKAAVIGKLCLSSCVQMGSCRGMSSSLQRPTYISWCVDSESPTPVATAQTATGKTGVTYPLCMGKHWWLIFHIKSLPAAEMTKSLLSFKGF